jgi:hypothetical protein
MGDATLVRLTYTPKTSSARSCTSVLVGGGVSVVELALMSASVAQAGQVDQGGRELDMCLNPARGTRNRMRVERGPGRGSVG